MNWKILSITELCSRLKGSFLMNVLYDHQIFCRQNYGGISRYFSELIHYYAIDNDIEVTLSLKYSNNLYLDKIGFDHNKLLNGLNFKGKHIILDSLNKRCSIKKLLKSEYDIFHPTYYNPYFLDYIGNTPYVLTIHDMIHEIYPDFFPAYNQISKNKKILAENATKIIAVSENTKKDIMKYLNVGEDKIEVVYHGNPFSSINFENKFKLYVGYQYILYVGDRQTPYKNFKFFVKSISSILENDSSLCLLCIGGGKFTKNELNLFDELQIIPQVMQANASEIELPHYYKNALAFVYPSLYEGFGLPILEAFSCGAPVALSNSSCFPEVAEDAGIYFDPKSMTSIRDSVYNLIYDEDLRKILKLKGHEQLNKFSWKLTARKTREVYEDAIENRLY